MNSPLPNRTAIVTGASTGIGAATALALADGYSGIVIHARKSRDALEAVAERVRGVGVKVSTVYGDLTDETLPARLVDRAEEEFGRLDCVVANAGFPILKSFEEGTTADLDYGFKGNVYSFFGIVRAAAPLLRSSDSGRVVAVGSFTSHVFRTDIRQYPMSAASKGALEVAVRGMAMHLADSGVTVNCVVPGMIEKDAGTEDAVPEEELLDNLKRIPLGRAGRAGDVAAAIRFLASVEAAYITGQCLHVNGGLSL